jgi:hypothetical protein
VKISCRKGGDIKIFSENKTKDPKRSLLPFPGKQEMFLPFSPISYKNSENTGEHPHL